MTSSRSVGVILVAVTVCGIAACGAETPASAPAASSQNTTASSEGGIAVPLPAPANANANANANDALEAAAGKLKEESCKISQNISGIAKMNMHGAVDPVARKGQLSVDVVAASTRFDIIAINGDVWVKYHAVPGISGRWQHIPATKLKAGGRFDLMPANDLAGASKLVKGVRRVDWDGHRAFKGTFDFSTIDKTLDGKEKLVPFSATIDDKGRLTSFTVDMSAAVQAAGQLTTSFSDFGTPVAVSPPPAADTIEAPESLLSKQ